MDARPTELRERADTLRAALRDRHGSWDAGDAEDPAASDHDAFDEDAFDQDAFAKILNLTGVLLDTEDAIVAARREALRRRGELATHGAAALLGIGAVAVAVTGLLGGWISVWGVAGAVLVLTLAVVLVVNARWRPDDLRMRLVDAGACLAVGALLLVVAAGLLPWWADLLVLVAFAVGAVVAHRARRFPLTAKA